MKTNNFRTATQDNFTFNGNQNFDFSKFKSLNSIPSAQEFFKADNFFAEKGVFEFIFFLPITKENFTEFTNFFVNEIAPQVKKGSSLKFNFFFQNFESQFNFTEFSEFFNQFLKDDSTIEFSFFPIPSNFTVDNAFPEFKFPVEFESGNFKFFVRQAVNR